MVVQKLLEVKAFHCNRTPNRHQLPLVESRLKRNSTFFTNYTALCC